MLIATSAAYRVWFKQVHGGNDDEWTMNRKWRRKEGQSEKIGERAVNGVNGGVQKEEGLESIARSTGNYLSLLPVRLNDTGKGAREEEARRGSSGDRR